MLFMWRSIVKLVYSFQAVVVADASCYDTMAKATKML
jgi:hypothetical protein